jgi:hypothetical protein
MMSISESVVSNGDNAQGDNTLLNMASATITNNLNNEDKQKSVMGPSSEVGPDLLPLANDKVAVSVDSTAAKVQ